MEEKKVNDVVVIKALVVAKDGFGKLYNGNLYEDALDLIEHQKAEIKRLTEELETKKKECRGIADDYQEMGTFYYNETVKSAELQKQVDELKMAYKDLVESCRNCTAVKNTAKEIFEKLLGFMGSKQKFVIVNDDNKTLIDCDELFGFVGQLAKEQGVEVE